MAGKNGTEKIKKGVVNLGVAATSVLRYCGLNVKLVRYTNFPHP